MLDIAYIREHPDEVKESIRRRGLKVDLDQLLALDQDRTAWQQKSEALRSRLKPVGKPDAAQLQELKKLKAEFESADKKYHQARADFQTLLAQVPNLIAKDTPDGDESANRVEKTAGQKPQFDFEPQDHLALSAKLQLVDFTAGAKVAGSKFYYGFDKLVRLEWAINSLALDLLRKAGFSLVAVPQLVKERITAGTGFAPRGDEDQVYKIDGEDLYLIATAEIPLSGLYADEVMMLEQPKLLAAHSTCFRKEAGAYGKFSKGLYRVHQFNKIEMYIYCLPKKSDQCLQSIIAIQEKICQKLEIPYRLVRTAAGELSAPAYEKYDIEYWSPVDQSYRELTSCSNCTDYQARRLNIRYRTEDGKLAHPHTLNGTAVTSSRTVLALLENHQTASGEVNLPPELYKYYGEEKL